MRPLRSLTHHLAHGHTWGLLPACSPKGEEHIRKLLCRNRLRGLSWKGTSQSRLFATASKQPACPQSGHEPEKFPIRHITFTTPADERARLLEKGKNLYNYCLTKNDQSCVTGFVEHHLLQQPEESDVVHDLLAFLAEEMVRLNKGKRALQKDFLDWLVTMLRILPDKESRRGIDVLTGKSKLADYPGDYQKSESPLAFGELLNILQKNKGRLGVSLSDASLVDRIKKTYEESLQRILPLKERLARTDRLTDQVVYRLYGLTEEEIKVVEGKGS